jgi:hypothetical protein
MLAPTTNGGRGENMNAVDDAAQQAQWLRWRSVADLYHAFFTGLILDRGDAARHG